MAGTMSAWPQPFSDIIIVHRCAPGLGLHNESDRRTKQAQKARGEARQRGTRGGGDQTRTKKHTCVSGNAYLLTGMHNN